MKRIFILIIGFMMAMSAQAESIFKSDDAEIHLKMSENYIASRSGVSIDVLKRFYNSLGFKELSNPDISSVRCFDDLENNNKGREAFLDCLSYFGRGGLSERLFKLVFNEKLLHIKNYEASQKMETRKSIAFLSWLEDVIRVQIKNTTKVSDLYINDGESSFFKKGHIFDYEFENGDVVLSIGNSSISSLIASVTEPQRRHSHAFLIKKQNGKTQIIESLIQTGVKYTSMKEFRSHQFNHVLVMRLPKNTPRRAEIIDEAVKVASRLAEQQVKYDGDMDIFNHDRIFCSELLAVSYSLAATKVLGQPIDIEDLTPAFAKIRSEQVKKFLTQLGVSRDVMPSPGDLISSSYLEVAADWRDTDHLFDFWVNFLATDILMERLENNFVVRQQPGLISWIKRYIAQIANSGKKYFTKPVLSLEMGIIPEVLSGKELVFLMDYDKKIFSPLVQSYNSSLSKPEKSLLTMPVWQMRGMLSYLLAQDKGISKILVNSGQAKSKRLLTLSDQLSKK